MFITLEGPEGAGKSSVAKELLQLLPNVLLTREPGGSFFGPKVREILLTGEAIDSKAELLLFLADRAQHVAGVIRPALANGKIVICDRFADSTVAYQGYGRGLNLKELRDWNRFATTGLVPDLTILFDLDPRVGLDRISRKDRLDAEPMDFHLKVREGFLKEAALDPARWKVIDASQPLHKVTQAVLQAVKEKQANQK